MDDEDFLLDEGEDIEEGYFIPPSEDDADDDLDEEFVDTGKTRRTKAELAEFKGKLTERELDMSNRYTLIKTSDDKNLEKVVDARMPGNVIDAIRNILASDPINTSAQKIENDIKDVFNLQGHNRIPASIYSPSRRMRGNEMGDDYGNTDDAGFNEELIKEARLQVEEFIGYLASRDLSKDTAMSRKQKQKNIPAFIIFLFNAGMYDLILDCPTMPPEYDRQIKNAFRKLYKRKYDVIEELAQKYEEMGRKELADKVRSWNVRFFVLEPNQILARSSLAYLNITPEEIALYKEYRPKYLNASNSITQETISDMIEVVIDEKAGLREKLKDKTKSKAIEEVKSLYREWCKNNYGSSELADKIIWNNFTD